MEHRGSGRRGRLRRHPSIVRRNMRMKTVGLVHLTMSLSLAAFLATTVALPLILQPDPWTTEQWMYMAMLVISIAILVTLPLILIESAHPDVPETESRRMLKVWTCLHWLLVPYSILACVAWFLSANFDLQPMICELYAWFKLIILLIISCKTDTNDRVTRRSEEIQRENLERDQPQSCRGSLDIIPPFNMYSRPQSKYVCLASQTTPQNSRGTNNAGIKLPKCQCQCLGITGKKSNPGD